MCFLSSSGGFQSGEVLSLCGSEVRALRLRRQTGEFQIKNVPSTHFFFDLRPLSRACGSPSALHQPLFTSCQAVIYIALPCAPRRALSLTHLHAPTNPHKSSGRSFACALGFIRVFCSFVPAEELSLCLKLELTRIEKISVDARDNSQAGPSTHGPTELAHDRKTNCTTCTAQVWVYLLCFCLHRRGLVRFLSAPPSVSMCSRSVIHNEAFFSPQSQSVRIDF